MLISVKQILRRLSRSPVFATTTLITLALGVAATTAVFSVIECVLLKPLSYPDADQLIALLHRAPGWQDTQLNMGPANYFFYRQHGRTFQNIGLYQKDSVTVTVGFRPEQVRALDVTDGTLPLLGVAPLLGRWLNRTDDSPGAAPTVMLNYEFWRRNFGSDTSIVGRTINVDGKLRLIIGVMPAHFHFLDWEDPMLILPLQLDPNHTFLGEFSYDGIARLKPGATLAEANADIARMLPRVLEAYPAPPGYSLTEFQLARLRPDLQPLKQQVVGAVGKVLWILMGSVGLVLFIACANAANLMLVRAEKREQEFAICAALGADRGRIARELLLESAIVSLLGAIIGILLAYGVLRLLVWMAPASLPRLNEIRVEWPVLLFASGVWFLASVCLGSISFLKYGKAQCEPALRAGGRSLSQSRERHRARNILVVVQVGLAFVLLVASGLMLRTFDALTHVNPGFADAAHVQTFRITIPQSQAEHPAAVIHIQQQMIERVSAISGVKAAGLINSLPMDGSPNPWRDPVFVQGRHLRQGVSPPMRRFKFVSPGLFSALGIPFLAGRDLTWAETDKRSPVAIVSANFAHEYWADASSALGQPIRVTAHDDWREIIGVVGDVSADGLSVDAPKIIYWPIIVNRFEGDPVEVRRTLNFAIHTPRAGSQSFVNEVQKAIWAVNPNVPLAEPRTLDYFYAKSMARTSFTLVMLAIAAAAALVLGTVGLYGVITYSVTQRRREIGIRIALGALDRAIVAMFISEGLVLTAAGIFGGFIVALSGTRLLSSLLFHVSTFDPWTYVAACCALCAITVLASYLPSRHTGTVDPAETLRNE